MIKNLTNVTVISFLLIMLSGCMSELTGTTYTREEARHMQEVKFGTIEEVNLVKLEGAKSGVGTLAGAAVGGVAAGSNIGGGSGSAVAAIAGAVAGGILGSMAEEKLTKKQGVELMVKLENGTFVSVVQQVDPNSLFSVGEQVKILIQSGTSRVVKLN